VVEEGSVANNRVALSELSSHYPGALIVMEAGCHSPWVSRHLEQAGCEVIVSNPRKTRGDLSARTQERASVRGSVLVFQGGGESHYKCLPESERENFNDAVFAFAFYSRRQDRELLGEISRGLLDCPRRV